MFESLNHRLTDLKKQIREKEKLEILLKEHQSDLKKLYHQLTPLEEELSKETNDVKQLEGFSLSNLLLTLCGDLEDYLYEEHQQLAACRLKYDETCRAIKRIEDRIIILNEKLDPFLDTESLYNLMVSAKEALILEVHHPSERSVVSLTQEKLHLEKDLQELERCLSVTHRILCAIENIGQTLRRAIGWDSNAGSIDGVMASTIRQEEIERAQSQAQNIQELLISLNAELSNLNESSDSVIKVEEHTRFMDIFIEHILVDITVQNSTPHSIEYIREIKTILYNLKKQLVAVIKNKRCLLNTVSQELSTVVTTAE